MKLCTKSCIIVLHGVVDSLNFTVVVFYVLLCDVCALVVAFFNKVILS